LLGHKGKADINCLPTTEHHPKSKCETTYYSHVIRFVITIRCL